MQPVDFWTDIGVNKAALTAGVIGGVISLRWVPECGWLGRVGTALCAGVLSNYATAPIYEWAQIKGLSQGGVGLMVGLFGMSIVAAVFRYLQDVQLKDVVARLTGRNLGGGTP